MRSPVIRHRPVEVCGRRAVLLEAGGGPAVVVLASTLVLARSYLDTVRALARRGLSVTVVGIPGSGRGTRLWRPWSFAEYARWTFALLERLSIERATVVGHSMSGAIAVEMARARGDRVARIVLADTIGADGVRSLLRVLIGRTIDCGYEPVLTLEAWHHVLLNAVYHPVSFWDQVRLSGYADITGAAGEVRVPALMAWGELDHTMPPRCATLLHELIPRSVLHVEPGVSHDWMITHAERFAGVVAGFVPETS